MNLEEFATLAGVEIFECGPEWGGKVGYKTKDHPNVRISGFRTKNSAYRNWAKDTFGEHAGKALMKLLSK